MDKTTESDLGFATIESKPIKILWNIGPHLVCIIDKDIVKKLKIDGGSFCEQSITNEGAVLLKIRRF